MFGALLVSADALLAEWVAALLPDLTVDTVVLRIFVTIAVGGAVLAAAYLALNPPRVERRDAAPRPVGNRYEWLAPVAVVITVFAAFLIAQATVVFGGHDYLRATTGLTYADYVHQGFGQAHRRHRADPAGDLDRVPQGATHHAPGPALAAGHRGPALPRDPRRGGVGALPMHVYQEAYGFTRLRLLVDVFEGWLGLLVLAVLASGIALKGAWLPRFALVSGVAALLGLAALNPDAWIAQHNVERLAQTGRVDWNYPPASLRRRRPRARRACRTTRLGVPSPGGRRATTTGSSGTSAGPAPLTPSSITSRGVLIPRGWRSFEARCPERPRPAPTTTGPPSRSPRRRDRALAGRAGARRTSPLRDRPGPITI